MSLKRKLLKASAEYAMRARELGPLFKTEGVYISRVYFWVVPNEYDFMAQLYRELNESTWKLTYRFRVYHSPDAFNFEDDKYAGEAALVKQYSEEEAAIECRRVILDYMSATVDVPVALDEVTISSSDSEVLLERLSTRPWCHIREIPKPD